ncbi:MAG: hypothetical protein WAO35_02695 [Terriglobia bacterium]
MIRTVKERMYCLVFAAALASVPGLRAQEAKTPPTAPVPTAIVNGKRVFISNAGMDSTSLAVFKREGDPDEPYNHFYAAMKNWGRYELVASPADADLVLEIRFIAPLTDCGKVTSYDPQLNLAIVDAKTHFRLWTFTEPVQVALRKATWDKNFSQGMTNLLDDIKRLAAPPAATVNPGND